MRDSANFVMDFTHTYRGEWIGRMPRLSRLDCSDIGGTDLYCSREAEAELQRRIAAFPPEGIHFLDSGNYHYLTGLFVRRIQEPYNLLFFDHHNDMKPTLIPELLSCGAWAKRVLEEEENLRRLLLIGPSRETLEEIGEMGVGHREKLFCISREELEAAEGTDSAENAGAALRGLLSALWEGADEGLPLYLSIDKDVLSEEYARTNWDQGTLSLPLLKTILADCCRRSRILGVDICGELPDASPAQAAEARRINERTDTELYRLLLPCFSDGRGF